MIFAPVSYTHLDVYKRQILSCELIDNNGKELKKCCNNYAKDWNLEAEFIDWMNNANKMCIRDRPSTSGRANFKIWVSGLPTVRSVVPEPFLIFSISFTCSLRV